MAKAKKSAVDEAVKGAKRGAAKGWNDSMAVAKGSAKILMDAAKAIEKQVFPYTHSGSKFATHRREAAAARKVGPKSQAAYEKVSKGAGRKKAGTTGQRDRGKLTLGKGRKKSGRLRGKYDF